MRIHTDANGVAVNAISSSLHGEDVNGHLYQVLIGSRVVHIEFQNGPVKEAGVNGLTNEALLAIVKHRLFVLNSRTWCEENDTATRHITSAIDALEARTYRRTLRGVEGTDVA